MKKLVIATVVACAAIVSQAATAVWGMENDGAKTYAYNSVLMILDSSTDAVTEILNKGGEGVLDSLAAYNINGAGVAAVSKKGASDGVYGSATTGDNYRWLLIQSTDGSATDGTGYLLTDAVSYATMNAAGAIVEGEKVATPYALVNGTGTDLFKAGTSGTIGSSAPEPTSAMLLLLGVAGLALKRRRA